MQSQAEARSGGTGSRIRRVLLAGLRISPWVIFGPITGAMSEAAALSFRKGRPWLGVFYVVLNVSVLLALPLLTAAIAHRL